VNNIKKKLPENLQSHCITLHKCVEYAPVYYEIQDDKGNYRTTMRFEPSYHRLNKLPHISVVIIEESSMVGTDLFAKLIDALPAPQATQFVFLGDLNQLPPIFGPSILGFKLSELPVVELTQIYRQALLSPIISLATAIRTNDFSDYKEVTQIGKDKIIVDRVEHGKVTSHPWKGRIDKDYALQTMHSFLPAAIDGAIYNPEEDIILCPFNKSFGTIELNKIIANHLARKRDATVYEVIARYQRSHWAVGDRVLVDRHEAIIEKISHAVGYSGPLPQDESKTLDYWGNDSAIAKHSDEDLLTAGDPFDKLDALAATVGTGSDDEEAKNMASHFIDVFIPDLGITKTLTTAGEINSMLHGYAITVHKSQGSEWRRVFLLLHNSHATMMSRELLYTAVTRAKQELYIVCEADAPRKGTTPARKNTIVAAAARPVIPGTALADKIAYFAQKAKEMALRSTQQQSIDEGE
jgi:ATP-dependent exoDNAse (exonuclease V) alpha subunit